MSAGLSTGTAPASHPKWCVPWECDAGRSGRHLSAGEWFAANADDPDPDRGLRLQLEDGAIPVLNLDTRVHRAGGDVVVPVMGLTAARARQLAGELLTAADRLDAVCAIDPARVVTTW